MNNRKFRCIKSLTTYSIENDHVLIDYIEEFEEEGFIISYDIGGHLDDLYFEVGKTISYDLYDKLCGAIEDVHEFFQEVTPAEELLKDIINYTPNESKDEYASNRFNVDKNGGKYYMELDIERSYYNDDLIPVFKIEITEEQYEYLRKLEKENE